jgi:septal ring factor EnvC (AmiA/AmiB activator)
MEVKEGDFLARGDKIGTVGADEGNNFGYLHLEMRSEIGRPLMKQISLKDSSGDDWSS